MGILDAPGLTRAEAVTKTDLGRNFASDFTGKIAQSADFPQFTKYAGNPIIAPNAGTMTTLYWPWVVRVDGIVQNPVNTYYLYISTDHDVADGHIGLYTASNPLGPWSYYGRVFQDTDSGNETETPSVIWVPDSRTTVLGTGLAIDAATDRITKTAHGLTNGRRVNIPTGASAAGLSSQADYYVVGADANTFQLSFTQGGAPVDVTTTGTVTVNYTGMFHMYYQQVGSTGRFAAQTTNLATSPDGLNWTRIGIALDITDATTWPGPSHTGYFNPHRIGGKWVGISLLVGENQSRWAISYSVDGIKWELDPRPLGFGAEYLADGVERIEWNSSHIINWRGQLLWIGVVSSFASGGGYRTGRWCAAPIARDLRSLIGPPRQLFSVSQPSWENDYMTFGMPFLDNDGKLYLYYRSGYPTTGIGVLTAEVVA